MALPHKRESSKKRKTHSGRPGPLPKYATFTETTHTRVVGYEGGGYFVLKLPNGEFISKHRRDLEFSNTEENAEEEAPTQHAS